MYLPKQNKKKYFFKFLSVFCGACLFSLVTSSAYAKNIYPALSEKSSTDIKNISEMMAQRLDLINGELKFENDDSINEMVESIMEMEKSLKNLQESFEQMRGDQSLSPIRGRNGNRHRGMGMRHGRMHGRRSLKNMEPQCPQTRNTLRVPDSLYNMVNPLENTPDNIEAGRVLFQLDVQPTCTMCHGFGDGRGIMADSLLPPPRNFSCKETMKDIPDGQLFGVITNGSEGTGMPAFFDLDDDQIWKLILYIRTLVE
jgi:mono/diheme cytochrome c family protein